MIKIRNALLAGAMGASALIAPVTMPAQLASAETVAGTPSTTPVLTSLGHPCREHKNPAKCFERYGGGGGGDIGDDDITRPGGGGIDD